MKKWTALVVVGAVVLSLVTPASAQIPGVTDRMVGAKKGMVAASHPLAAEAGRKVLAEGGNAVDAAAAMQLALNVVEPMMSGIGGGGFMMLYNQQEDKVTILDSREMAPEAATPQLFLDKDGKPIAWFERHTGGKAVGVPGTLRGVEKALERYGTKKLSEVIDPAIGYAEQGVKVNWATAKYIGENVAKLEQYGAAAEVFLPDGKPLQEGDLLVQKDLAKTLKLIKEQGTDVFYNGEVGKALVAEVQKRGGVMTLDDLKNYQVKERTPVRGNYRGFDIVSMPAPSSGGLTLLQIMELMEKYNVRQMGSNSTEYLHRLLEVGHLAYADRAAYMADEDYHSVPKTGLLDPTYITERSALVNPRKASSTVKAGNPWKYEKLRETSSVQVAKEDNPIGQTTHFSVVDQWGNMVAYTTTIEQVFGTGIMVPGYGLMLNNEMTDFDALPGGVNQIEPGKRPLSSMSPTLVFKDGKPFMTLGSPGGPTIIMSVVQTLFNVIDFNMPLQEAIEAPRVYSNTYPKVTWESGIDQKTVFGLLKKGHSMATKPSDIGNMQAIIYDASTGLMYGGADNTREGAVLGVEQVSYIAKAPQRSDRGNAAIRLMVDGLEYPFESEQMILQNSWSYADADLLMLALGATEHQIGHGQIIHVGANEYLPVRKTAESLGYTVGWDAKEQVVTLTKDGLGTDDQVETPVEDEYKVTN